MFPSYLSAYLAKSADDELITETVLQLYDEVFVLFVSETCLMTSCLWRGTDEDPDPRW